MRLLLASITCDKGDPLPNLDRHRQLLAEARKAGCDLVVFPEMSLTGSVDPRQHPERTVSLDDDLVGEMVAATGPSGVGALFGIAERRGRQRHISQVYAVHGTVQGVQRKRHLGEDEVGFAASTETTGMTLGAARFGSLICAESGVDHTWDASAATGAALLCLSSAPGLYERRTDVAGWRDGFDWWEGHGLAHARQHAQRLGVWVAMATQAGATEDEDFPGIAALVDPDGEVVARLPDWRPGTLLVDVPITVEVEPVRRAIRVLVVDHQGRTLLAQFGDEGSGRRWWVPPGGGMEAGEDDLATARRELLEEVGRSDLETGPPLGRRSGTILAEDRWFTQHERWYLSRVEHFEVDPAHVASLRGEGIRALRWWTPAELRADGVETGPRDLADLLDRIVAGDLPDPSGDLGF